jgi:hypothetical protein
MLRVLFVSAILLVVSSIVPAMAEPEPADDLATCRDRQADAALRLTACEKLIAAGQVTGKDLALQLPFMELSESMGNHDSNIVGADSVD